MNSRIVAAGITLAIACVVPVSGVAHAQDLNCIDFRYREDAQAEFNRDTSDPHRLDEDRGPDDGMACEWLPSRVGADVAQPVNPPPVNPQPVNPSATAPTQTAPAMPTRGTRAGVGGAAGPTDLGVGLGLGLVVGATVAGGCLAVRRVRRV